MNRFTISGNSHAQYSSSSQPADSGRSQRTLIPRSMTPPPFSRLAIGSSIQRPQTSDPTSATGSRWRALLPWNRTTAAGQGARNFTAMSAIGEQTGFEAATQQGAQIQLAGYLLARHLDQRPIEPTDIPRLKRMARSVQRTRAALPFGRDNIKSDVIATGGDSLVRTTAGYGVYTQFAKGDEREKLLTWAAASKTFGAGNCTEHSLLTALDRADDLTDNETVQVVTSHSMNHHWAISTPGQQGQRAIVADAWMDGPPVMAVDASPRTYDSVLFEINKKNAQTTSEQYKAKLNAANAKLVPRVPEFLRHAVAPGAVQEKLREIAESRRLPAGMDEPQSAVSREFADRARSAMRTTREHNRQHLARASAVAAGLDEAAAAKSVDMVINAAWRLDAITTSHVIPAASDHARPSASGAGAASRVLSR
ncbi:hypothetical protein GWC77_26405 [Paraburkholderia sp. NMBU_R16]|uniref:hypothetical protein n=1 Tax=Paraburkholderia sp. NMBU_R16 TaxID=2698676 RepID=UPI001566235C|nr:hypothetical protein [Paraburkholderia sp. NMBU_R16]NRO99419.1 hypothetical protein [Paraburkholderia sp. NMBU_R16]